MMVERDGAFIKYGPKDFTPGHLEICSIQLGDPAKCPVCRDKPTKEGDALKAWETSPMTDKIDTSNLGRIDLASGKSPAPIEECVSTWAVDDLVEELAAIGEAEMYDAPATTHATIARGIDRIQSLIADNERLREALQLAVDYGWEHETAATALSHKDMSR